MTNVYVIQPSEMGTDFEFDTTYQKWKLKNPVISTDNDNALYAGSDGGAFLANNEFKRYRIIQDNQARKIRFYTHNKDESFDAGSATLIDEVDMLSLDVQVDDVAISNGVITFTDVDTNTQLTFDTNSPIYQILTVNSNAINITGNGKDSALTIELIVDPSTDNLLKVTASGAILDKNDILALLNSNGVGTVNFTFAHDTNGQNLKVTINGTEQSVPTSRLLNSAGDVLGYVITP